MTGEHIAPNSRGGRLSPWADAAADAPGWQITTRSHQLAAAVATALSGRTVRCREKGEWHARIPHAVLMVVIVDADVARYGAVSAPSRIPASSSWPSRPGRPQPC